ncbi:M36 family metallopeptidase [Dokdonella sp.]|uniref:M36 family metallopeptidase n=1 Tax=Dokdonella sp. TaxID=2291710 RepID=UPI0025BA8AFB|nr:M36 family metallopeptidase [Dokdonella sp.]
MTSSRKALALAVLIILGAGTADAAERAGRTTEPLRLDSQPGWLDDGAADGQIAAPADAADAAGEAKASSKADRAAIVESARRALGQRGHAAAKAMSGDFGDAAVRVHATAQGPYIVQFPQSVDGVEVYGARVNVLLDRSLAVRAITGGVATSPIESGGFRRDAASALKSAAGAVDGLLAASALREVIKDKAPYRYFELDRSPTFAPGRAARIKPIWYPAASGLLPAYSAEFHGSRPGETRPVARAVIVSADDGRVLADVDLVRDHAPFAYRVFATPQGRPYNDPYGFTTPHPTGVPDGWRPTVPAPMNLVSLTDAGISTGDPWLPDDATETVGNNVDAFFGADLVDDDGRCNGMGLYSLYDPTKGDLRATLTGPRTFDYAYDADDSLHDFVQCPPPDYVAQPIPPASAQLQAKAVQFFYIGNWLHDYFYDLGFDEEAGNMQQDNYGRGGVGGDPLLLVTGGAHPVTATSLEGESPLITMGNSRYSLSRRDTAAFDLSIIGHEWTHAMMARLSQSWLYTSQAGALGEGSGDFIGQMLVLRGQDRNAYPGRPPFSGAYPPGAYTNLDYDVDYDALPPAGSPGYADNAYYYGTRRFPFSPDLAVNPLTFKHVSLDHPLPPSPHANDWLGRSLFNAETHSAGEIWAISMWECARNVLAAKPPARFEQTRRRFLGDVVAGFKLLAGETTFTEARDAMLFAIRADNEADYRRCRAGFAKRGLGAGAVSPERYSITLNGAIESFEDREYALSILDTRLVEVSGGDGDGVLDRGESGRVEITLRNSGFSPLRRVGVRVDAARADFDFPGGRRSGEIELAPGATATVGIDVRVANGHGDVELPLAISARDRQRAAAQASAAPRFRVNYDLVRDRVVDEASFAPTFAVDWTLGSSEAYPPGWCLFGCDLQWQRGEHLGEPAYVIRDDGHIGFDATLEGREFLVSTTDPLRIALRHDYLFDRAPGDPMLDGEGIGYLQVGIDGGDWEDVGTYLVSGPVAFEGRSNGWRDDTLDFGTALAGHRVKFRWTEFVSRSWTPSSAFWAIARIRIDGASEPMFSRVVAQ